MKFLSRCFPPPVSPVPGVCVSNVQFFSPNLLERSAVQPTGCQLGTLRPPLLPLSPLSPADSQRFPEANLPPICCWWSSVSFWLHRRLLLSFQPERIGRPYTSPPGFQKDDGSFCSSKEGQVFVAIAGFDLETSKCSSALRFSMLTGAPLLFNSHRPGGPRLICAPQLPECNDYSSPCPFGIPGAVCSAGCGVILTQRTSASWNSRAAEGVQELCCPAGESWGSHRRAGLRLSPRRRARLAGTWTPARGQSKGSAGTHILWSPRGANMEGWEGEVFPNPVLRVPDFKPSPLTSKGNSLEFTESFIFQ